MAFTEDNSGAKQPEFGAQRAEPGKRWRRGVAMGKGMEWKRKLSGDQTQHEEFAEEAILGHGCPRLPASTSKARHDEARQGADVGLDMDIGLLQNIPSMTPFLVLLSSLATFRRLGAWCDSSLRDLVARVPRLVAFRSSPP